MNKWLALTGAAMLAAVQAGCAQTGPVAAAAQSADEGTVIAASLGYHGPAARRPARQAD
jgi:hypothetical protein